MLAQNSTDPTAISDHAVDMLAYPTKEMMDWQKSAQLASKAETRAKLFIGLTRARHAVAG